MGGMGGGIKDLKSPVLVTQEVGTLTPAAKKVEGGRRVAGGAPLESSALTASLRVIRALSPGVVDRNSMEGFLNPSSRACSTSSSSTLVGGRVGDFPPGPHSKGLG